ncbi:hypothetical protein PG994_013717 [Apiospora phragmitis]|uniref:Uncharacterized protein n=1 Tax=Apiospora phragmitis TaxID=2905665 RepID=A0ABR1TBR9_9PEZI
MANQPDLHLHLGPLTTVFTAPLSCSQSALLMYDDFDCDGATTSILRGPVDTAPAAHCFPPSLNLDDAAVGGRAPITAPESARTGTPRPGLSYRCSVGSEWSWGLCHAALDGGTATLTDLRTVKCGTSMAGREDFLWDGVAQAQSIQVRFRREDASLFDTSRSQAQITSSNEGVTAIGHTEEVGSSTVQENGERQFTSTWFYNAFVPTDFDHHCSNRGGLTRTISRKLGQSQQELAMLQGQSGPPKFEHGDGEDEGQPLAPAATSHNDTFHASWQILRPPQELMGEKTFEMDATPAALLRYFSLNIRWGNSPASDRSDGIDAWIARSQGIILTDYKDTALGDPATESRWSG